MKRNLCKFIGQQNSRHLTRERITSLRFPCSEVRKSIQDLLDRRFMIQAETSTWQEFLAWPRRKEAANRTIH